MRIERPQEGQLANRPTGKLAGKNDEGALTLDVGKSTREFNGWRQQ
jgi:hypothetical protein